MSSERGREKSPPGKGALFTVFLTVMIDLMGFGLMMPLIPVYAKDFGASAGVSGLLVATYSMMQLVCAPILGRLSDRIGRRPILLLGLGGSCVSYAIFAVAPSLAWLFVSRALAGAFGATISTAQAYVADVTTPETRSRGMGLLGAAFGIGFVIGPALGGLLTQLGNWAPGAFASALSAIAFLVGFRRLVESHVPQERATDNSLAAAFRLAFASRERAALLTLSFVMIYAFANFEAMFSLFGIDTLGLHRSEMAYYVALVGLWVAIVQGGLIHRLVKRLGERMLFVVGAGVFVGGYVLLAQSTSMGAFALACVAIGLGQGAASPTLNAMISAATPASSQGAVFGVSQSLASLARVVGHSISGQVYQRLGAGDSFLISAGALAVGAAVLLNIRKRPADDRS
jgi:MFS transporter, DHA1 family, tetracycline resistance protein